MGGADLRGGAPVCPTCTCRCLLVSGPDTSQTNSTAVNYFQLKKKKRVEYIFDISIKKKHIAIRLG